MNRRTFIAMGSLGATALAVVPKQKRSLCLFWAKHTWSLSEPGIPEITCANHHGMGFRVKGTHDQVLKVHKIIMKHGKCGVFVQYDSGTIHNPRNPELTMPRAIVGGPV